jgi:solute carrier family 25 (peroxisomal adenine nucleotide transporter), member 17
MLAGLIAGSHLLFVAPVSPFLSEKNNLPGSATTVISNPVWVIQTAQTVNDMDGVSAESSAPPPKRLGLRATAVRLLRTGGPAAFFRGLGPALVLVVNPVLQYTVFEQLKNALIRRRRTAGRVGTLLTDWDFFFLGAISKLGVSFRPIIYEVMLMPNT